ncbi:MAG: glutamine amidotransferase [Limisphaerales bacterium]
MGIVLGEIVLSGRDWVTPAAILGGVGFISLFWSYAGAKTRAGVRPLCIFLRLLGLAALIVCLLEPHWTGQRAKPGANLFVVLADNSQGMEIHDRSDPKSRGDQLKKVIDGGNAPWHTALRENFNVRDYYFDSKLRSTDDYSELNFKGRSSALCSSLEMIRDRYEGRPLAGIILLTDGNATDLPDTGMETKGLAPVYPVAIGRNESGRDISVKKIAVTQTAFEDAPVSLVAHVDVNGFQNEKIVSLIYDNEGEEVARKVETTADSTSNLRFQFQLKPAKPGVSFFRLYVSTEKDLEKNAQKTDDGEKTSREATLANNSRIIAVDRGSGPYRVLYVSGRPNWEFKFLSRSLKPDDQTDLVGLVRIAKREPKFVFRGRIGESSNPLFRGFGNQSEEEIQRYDQPVLIRINTKDEEELRTGFPANAETLYEYSAIILDDIESEFFTTDQKSLIRKFVSERGGGFMMLGGIDTFQDGKYDKTPIADLLPFYVGNDGTMESFEALRFELTREGLLQNWVRLRQTEGAEKDRIDLMPDFSIINPLGSIKPGASVVATVSDMHGEKHPAIAVQRFGHGRTAALTIGDFWKWGMRDPELNKDFSKSWRQMIRYLVADVPRRVELEAADIPGDPNQAVQLTVRAKDHDFQALDNASVDLNVIPISDDGVRLEPIRLQAEPDNEKSGIYTATYVPRGTGGYLAQTSVTNAAGANVGKDEAGWTTDLAAEEFRSLTPNRAFLESLAKQTGGEMIFANSLASFARGLPNKKSPVMEVWSEPLWHTPLVFAFALACFVAEWGLRRWRGLP